MFEKFDIDSLYFCDVSDIVPLGMTNFGGCISIDYVSSKRYSTVVCLRNGKYYDIDNLDRNMNIVRCPQIEMPLTSKDNHLYLIEEETLVPYKEKENIEGYSVLQRLPFGKKRYI